MRNRPAVALAVVVVLGVAMLAAHGAEAGPRKTSRAARTLLAAPSFTDAAEFSGTIDGELYVNGTRYRLAPDAVIFEVGVGVVPRGSYYSGRVVSVSGVAQRRQMMVQTVIVRPARSYTAPTPPTEIRQGTESDRPQ